MQKMPPELYFVEPMECKAVEALPTDRGEWQYEIKFDGYRAIAIKQRGEAELFSRNGNAFTETYRQVADAIAQLRGRSFILDGELVAIDREGRHSFSLLQHRQADTRVYYYVFDLLHLDGKDLKAMPLHKRRSELEAAFPRWPDLLRLSPLLEGDLDEIEAKIRHFQFEGIVAKQKASVYRPGDAPGMWVKHKMQRSEDFVVGGYIPGAHGVDQLVVGIWEADRLLFVESVKNGFVPTTRRQVKEAIENLEIADCPFSNLPEKKRPHAMDREKMATVRWVKPKVVCEIAFNEWTPNRHLRHSQFLRLRGKMDLAPSRRRKRAG